MLKKMRNYVGRISSHVYGYNAGQQEPLQWQSNIIGFISLSHLDLSQEKNALMESPFIFIRFLIHLIFMLNECYELDEPFLPG